ncbi:MAG: peptide chain release factor N(5)-glutamine methyltransferase [Candidatus Cloacimonetes bacterium]|mgnify:CR=1 FL=1|nr:peptide chain release factor N(5)-glutamine methyltransferase [Candidatus Cloacimonadota bacterium]MBT6993451.1 peptide chain release factor N(5)-glutamine methyltransferase [Candidatus Cloacimonadota bacterium]MBT7469555.1 peptide chain release factor N(5)-glutamine methyltransferase [Candidatus Cloacimonadota bacterium]
MPQNIKQILQIIIDNFAKANINTAKIEAEIILSSVLNLKRFELYLNLDKPILKNELETILTIISRRKKREPLQYILGETEFYDCKIKVNKYVLIPRPETEFLIEKIILENPKIKQILDIGTGSGAIAIALAKFLPNCQIDAIDISINALEIAKNNAVKNNVNITFSHSNLFENANKRYNLIVSNPPYISKNNFIDLQPEITKFEPITALVAGENGLYFYRKILENAKKYLTDDGKIYFEIGHNQAKIIKNIATLNGFKNIEICRDLNNFDRIMVIA